MSSRAGSPPHDGGERTTRTRNRRGGTAADPSRGHTLLVCSPAGVRAMTLDGRGEYVLGRAPDCDVCVPDGSLSRHHARLTVGAVLELTDLGSKNGTTVQGARAAKGVPQRVGVGTVFELGSVTFVLQRGSAERPVAAPRPPTAPPLAEAPTLVDPTMRNLYALLALVAPSPLNVLVLGETGVGKELYARAVHAQSTRARKPFVAIHCAALPESMLEAELFGYEKGAFTGAVSAKEGLLESAADGTVFLDEVGDISLATQAKLLRAIETGEVTRLGNVRPRRIDVRYVAATHRDLRELLALRTFRADLYFRLNGMTVTLPPLRTRVSDIGPLARTFAERAARAMGRAPPRIDDAAMRRLEAYAWPGNVRELKNVVERAVVLSGGRDLDVESLELGEAHAAPKGPAAPAAPHAPPREDTAKDAESLRASLRQLEKERVQDALVRAGGNQTEAAKLLGMSRYTMMSRMEEFGIRRPRKGR